MAWKNIDERRSAVSKVLEAGYRIGPNEANILGIIFSCSSSAIKADVKIAGKEGSEKTSFLGPQRGTVHHVSYKSSSPSS
jgi:hypothetical protein